jgi:high-affinity nickel permease
MTTTQLIVIVVWITLNATIKLFNDEYEALEKVGKFINTAIWTVLLWWVI